MTAPGDAPGLSDEAIVEHIGKNQSNSEVLFEILVHRYRGWILHRCRSYLGNSEDAEDATQEVLLRVYRNLPGFERRAAFRTWLHSIVYNQCHTVRLQRTRRAIDPAMHQELVRLETERRAPPSHADHRPLLKGLLGEMPDSARDILLLRYLRGLPLASIAEQAELSLSATKMRLYRALETARRIASRIGVVPSAIAR